MWMGGNPADAEDALGRGIFKAWEKIYLLLVQFSKIQKLDE